MVTVKNKKERKTMFVYEIRRQRNNGRKRYYVMWQEEYKYKNMKDMITICKGIKV